MDPVMVNSMQAYQGHYLVGNLSPVEHRADESYPVKDREIQERIHGWTKVLKQLREIERRRDRHKLDLQYSSTYAKGGTKSF